MRVSERLRILRHIKVPTDAARITTLSTGTWNKSVFYSISYKTNMHDYRSLAKNPTSRCL